MKQAIAISGLWKSYGEHAVLKGLDLCIAAGECFALLGVNGAGKTTALECMEGLRKYDKGRIEVSGKLGIQLQAASLPACIRPMEAVRLFAKWNGAPLDNAMLQRLGIREMGKKQYAQLSTGQKRRLHLALALIPSPDIVFLDEPTAGLDVEGRRLLHEQIRMLKSQGRTIVLASHDMAEVEALCDRIAILNEGKIAFCGTSAALSQRLGKKYLIHIRTNRESRTLQAERIGEALLALLEAQREQGEELLDIRIDRGTLEQHFLEIAGRTKK